MSAIARSALTATDRKVAIRRAVEVAILGRVVLDRGGQDPVQEKPEVHDYYEQVLAGISRLAGCTVTMKIEEAKEWVRSHDDFEAQKLAARLSRLSQRRNGRVHQDWLLLDAVQQMAARSPKQGLARENSQEARNLVVRTFCHKYLPFQP